MYTKLFGSIVNSTIWREPDYVRLVWITMLALADKNGCVWAAVPGLADAARVSLEDCEKALDRLTSPDSYSRTQIAEGRRIETIDGGWWIINYAKFQSIKNMDERREQVRLAVQRYRAKKEAAASEPVINVINGNPAKSGNRPVSPSDEDERTSAQITASSSSRETLLSAVPNRPAWEAVLNGALQGLDGPMLTAAQLERAVTDYVGNGEHAKPNLRHFRAYLRDAARPAEPRRSGGGIGQRAYDTTLDAIKDIA